MNTNYEKFSEWLTLKGYSKGTIGTAALSVKYFAIWAEQENIPEWEEVSYSDAMGFMKSCSSRNVSQKTIAHYLIHVRHFFNFLISEGTTKENPVAHIKVQGIKRRMYYDVLSTEQLQELYNLYPTTIEINLPADEERKWVLPPQEKNIISRKRNKVILSLLIHQGLRVEEVAAIRLQDLQLKEGKITIHAQRRIAARIMTLESHQVYELMDYIHEIRKEFLQENVTSDKLFLQRRQGDNFYGITQMMLIHLRKINSRIKNFEQIRTSVITKWLKEYDLRKVQYLAGHKYVSSTESYKENIIDELQDDVTKYHPL
jgi:site-specific recombinase XerD